MTSVRVRSCPRCGRNHEAVEAAAFTRPPFHYTHYATCPVTGQPILFDGVALRA